MLFALLIKNPLSNRYTRNQPIYFSMIPKIQIKEKMFFEILNLKISVCLKTLRQNLEQKIKLYFRKTHFNSFLALKRYNENKYTIFNF